MANATNTPQDQPPAVNTTPRAPKDVNPTGGTALQGPPVAYPGTAPIAKSGAPAAVQIYRRPDSIPHD